MCNAWNHPPGCTCGWGGLGHKGRGSTGMKRHLSSSWPPGIPPISASIHSITIPNAKCPVCGESVFYYCNEHGSSVFFDELGPPWPKHPCTDNENQSSPRVLSIQETMGDNRLHKWKTDGWVPYQVETIAEIDKSTFKLSLRSLEAEKELMLYLSSRGLVDARSTRELFPPQSMAFVLHIGRHHYSVSSLTPKLKAFSIDVYDLLIELHRASRSSKKKNRRKPKESKKQARNRGTNVNSERRKSTAMSLAFAKANEETHDK
jgi:hypothetical protein